MNISVSQFAKKIEKHVAEMKVLDENSPKLREHVSAIQTLCELMLEADEDDTAVDVKGWVPSYPVQKPTNLVTAPPPKKHKKSMMDYDMDYDDDDQDEKDGNGDSIFDF
ncbi:YwdI family protein [Fictibacillus norfolkensis]|uniref:YwdI family protein n=1 Tax=Fictibacillus norfolkensis TaxID=2762233 RepID=A0ABR8SS51_9BACL|nr:YwdI family protein [Fictibacillus norfolkensis]MBD7966332.1 YwdI family protein [Fictibacillus norfolkensis]